MNFKEKQFSEDLTTEEILDLLYDSFDTDYNDFESFVYAEPEDFE